jgi:hypothetical protein
MEMGRIHPPPRQLSDKIDILLREMIPQIETNPEPLPRMIPVMDQLL